MLFQFSSLHTLSTSPNSNLSSFIQLQFFLPISSNKPISRRLKINHYYLFRVPLISIINWHDTALWINKKKTTKKKCTIHHTRRWVIGSGREPGSEMGAAHTGVVDHWRKESGALDVLFPPIFLKGGSYRLTRVISRAIKILHQIVCDFPRFHPPFEPLANPKKK